MIRINPFSVLVAIAVFLLGGALGLTLIVRSTQPSVTPAIDRSISN